MVGFGVLFRLFSLQVILSFFVFIREFRGFLHNDFKRIAF